MFKLISVMLMAFSCATYADITLILSDGQETAEGVTCPQD